MMAIEWQIGSHQDYNDYGFDCTVKTWSAVFLYHENTTVKNPRLQLKEGDRVTYLIRLNNMNTHGWVHYDVFCLINDAFPNLHLPIFETKRDAPGALESAMAAAEKDIEEMGAALVRQGNAPCWQPLSEVAQPYPGYRSKPDIAPAEIKGRATRPWWKFW
jgi:hypothetical protein